MLKALNHSEPDRVPFDLGSTLVTGINHNTYRGLLPLLGLTTEREVKFVDIVQQIAVVDEDALLKLGVDTRGVLPREPSHWHLELQCEESNTSFKDQWGVVWSMPKVGGKYFDMISHPLCGDKTTDIDNFVWPEPRDPARWEGMADEAKMLREAGEYAVVMSAMGVTSGLIQTAQWLQGFENFYMNIAANPTFMHKLVDKLTELDMAFWESFLAVVGPYLDVVMYADDYAGQNDLLISMDMFREFFKGRYERIFASIKEKAPHVKIFFHSCGAVYKLIPEFIEVGVDILNPVQVSAAGMDTGKLKKEFGSDIVFWGGGIDTQHVLPHGTAQQVKDEVKRRIDDLAPGGGFVFNTVHNIQADVPPKNVIAMKKALTEYGAY